MSEPKFVFEGEAGPVAEVVTIGDMRALGSIELISESVERFYRRLESTRRYEATLSPEDGRAFHSTFVGLFRLFLPHLADGADVADVVSLFILLIKTGTVR